LNTELQNEIFQWDVKNWSKGLVLWEQYLQNAEGKTALTIGEREGGMSLFLAQKGVKVTCTDINEFPESTASLHQKYNVQEKITYTQADATALPFPDNHFDVVMFKSVIGALASKEKQQLAINELHRVLKPGGHLLFAENLAATSFHKAVRKRFIKWATYWRYLSFKKDQDLFSKFAENKFKTYGFWACFGRSEKQRRILSFPDKCSVILPKSWRYILFGACKK
jgi:ubiquinone/menaquinone biosynthesis C-methylase UbiE